MTLHCEALPSPKACNAGNGRELNGAARELQDTGRGQVAEPRCAGLHCISFLSDSSVTAAAETGSLSPRPAISQEGKKARRAPALPFASPLRQAAFRWGAAAGSSVGKLHFPAPFPAGNSLPRPGPEPRGGTRGPAASPRPRLPRRPRPLAPAAGAEPRGGRHG